MLIPLQKNIIEIDTSNTTQFDGEYNLLYRGEHIWKELKWIWMLKLRLIHIILCMVSMVEEDFYKFQIKWLNKQRKSLIGDVITIINRLRLESVDDEVSVIDVNIKTINKLKQCVDLSFRSKLEDDDVGYSNLYGLNDTPNGSDE